MMKPILFILFASLLFFSCKEKIPADVLPPEKMKLVKWDMMQADELVEYYGTRDTAYRTEEKRKEYYNRILELHQITQSQLDKSIDYYTLHPVQLRRLLDSLQKMGERLQQGTDAAPTELAPIDTQDVIKTRPDTLSPVKLFKKKRD